MRALQRGAARSHIVSTCHSRQEVEASIEFPGSLGVSDGSTAAEVREEGGRWGGASDGEGQAMRRGKR